MRALRKCSVNLYRRTPPFPKHKRATSTMWAVNRAPGIRLFDRGCTLISEGRPCFCTNHACRCTRFHGCVGVRLRATIWRCLRYITTFTGPLFLHFLCVTGSQQDTLLPIYMPNWVSLSYNQAHRPHYMLQGATRKNHSGSRSYRQDSTHR